MCPCNPNDVSFSTPDAPSGPAIPGFGTPFSIPVPEIPFPDGFPEDILDLMNKLQMLIPPGALKPQLNPNFGKDIYDGIMKLLDQFMPFLMLYKFFLPILNLIICIIEVLCALMNPFALMSALNRLFTQCIPEFLNLFPIFALILMIISLLLLLLALLLYLIEQILKFINAILRNIRALIKAFKSANKTSVKTIARKLGSLLCIFQNLFVLLALFAIIIQVIKDILSLIFSIPPCEGGGPGSTDGCCAATYCPSIVQGTYKAETGTFQYLPEAGYLTNIALGSNFLTSDLRAESWQIYDPNQPQPKLFWNIVDAYDVSSSVNPKPVFFPTDANYSSITSSSQAAYTVDLRLFYNPSQWSRSGDPRYIKFKDCIVLSPPTQSLKDYANNNVSVPNGVLYIAGGLGYEDDGTTVLTGFAADGTTPISNQATLGNFLHMAGQFSPNPILQPTDGYTFQNMEYTFKPNTPVLLQKNLINAKCMPDFAINSAFVNGVMFGGIGAQTDAIKGIFDGTSSLMNGKKFPDPAATQKCLQTMLSDLQNNMSIEGALEFQTGATICIYDAIDEVKNAIGAVIGAGFSPCKSNFTLEPSTQFTTQPILLTVNINENNGIPLTSGIPIDTAETLALSIVAYPTFGNVSKFTFDGYQAFNAILTSDTPGPGEITIAFQNQTLCTDSLPTNTAPLNVAPNGTTVPSHDLQKLKYNFVYSPFVTPEERLTGTGDVPATQPRRDPSDIAGDT